MINSTTSNYGVASYYLNQLKNAESATATEKTETKDYSEISTDQLTISISGQELADFLSSLSETQKRPQGPPPEGPPPSGNPGDKIAQEVDTQLEAFNEQLMAKLEAAGVDTEQEINLAYDSEGNIVVTNETEDKALIESILAEDSDLQSSFKELTDLTSLASAMQERFAQGPPPSGNPGDKIAQEVDTQLEAFNEQLMAKLEAAGVDTEQEINLAYDSEGNIVVTNETEDKALIESILAENSDLQSSFKELTDLTSLASAMQERFAQGPPPPPPTEATQKTTSNIASLYAANSTLTSNLASTSLMQRLAQLVS